MMGLSSILTASLVALRLFAGEAAATASPNFELTIESAQATSSWWLPNIQRQGTVAYGGSGNYSIYRNVMNYGAKGDGSSDDTAAINRAFSDGNRCGQGCDSTTVTPAIVYFPPGTYVVSSPIILYYYSHMIGDVVNPPTLKASAGFAGMAVIDSDPYIVNGGGAQWYTNQNNFFRQVRNFIIDLTAQPSSTGTGIHWQVAQATSLQNIVFNMSQDKSSNNKQQGIFMDNGSGGFMSDLTFNGGAIGAFFGNQQFTTRNLVFNGCQTAIYMNWNWLWTLQGVTINNANIGIDMTSGTVANQAVGSVVLLDSKISNTPVGIATNYNTNQGYTNSTLIVDNVDFSTNVPTAIRGANNAVVLGGNTKVASFVQGRAYSGSNGRAVQGTQPAPSKPAALLNGSGQFVTRSKPQYNTTPASSFVSVKSKGAKGDGVTDDTAAIQAVFNSVSANQIVYFDHGAYVITNTVKIPKNIKIVGEIWPLIMAGGNSNFKNPSSPKPVFQVGQPGDVGSVEIQDLIFETLGPQPGAILMEFNVAGTSPGAAAIWDVHFRVGGSAGTGLQSDKCSKSPNTTNQPNPACEGAFLHLHLTSSSSAYVENVWAWVSDHELDLGDHNQVSIYNGRGVLIEATKGTWLWGTAAEHSVLYNYALLNAINVFLGLIQTETAYFQGNPDATVPFTINPTYGDPSWSNCKDSTCARTWGLRVVNSKAVFVYGGGLYSFFNNYDQTCVNNNNCQDNMIDIENSSVNFYAVNTKASVNMISVNGGSVALDKDNRNNFCAGIASFSS